MKNQYDVLIVGGGQAGGQAGILFRQAGFAGSIGIVSAEGFAPYDRTVLSKEYLGGKKPFDKSYLLPPEDWAKQGLDLLLEREIVKVEPTQHQVIDADDEPIGYGKLIWAAGGNPKRLQISGIEEARIHYIRSRSDLDKLLTELPVASNITVIGGGYIGLEASAVLSTIGKHCTVVEFQDRLLKRVAGPVLSSFFERIHRGHGVEFRFSEGMTSISVTGSQINSVTLTSGEQLPTDLIIAGIGIEPVVEPLRVAGATIGNGIRVSEYCETSLPDIYAIGDVAEHPSKFSGSGLARLESIQNANDQAMTVVRHIMGNPQPYSAVPWFWSNQYDIRLQTVGIHVDADEVVQRGNPEANSFSLIYLRQKRVVALDCVNASRDYAVGRALVAAASIVDPNRVSDVSIPLKSFL